MGAGRRVGEMELNLLPCPQTPRFALLAVALAHLKDRENAGQATKLKMELPALISAPHKELGTVAFGSEGSLGFSGP